MIVGAAIAGFVIVSLFLEMFSSAPKPDKKHGPDINSVQ